MRADAGAQLGCGEVQAHGLVAAGDVEADGGGADAAFGGDDAADGHAVAEMSVGHEGQVVRGAGADPRLLQSVLLVRTPDGDVVDPVHHCDGSFLALSCPLLPSRGEGVALGPGLGCPFGEVRVLQQKKEPRLSPGLVGPADREGI